MPLAIDPEEGCINCGTRWGEPYIIKTPFADMKIGICYATDEEFELCHACEDTMTERLIDDADDGTEDRRI